MCDILDHEPWDAPVPLKDSDGEYIVADLRVWTNSRVYRAKGVLRIHGDRYDAILAAASAAPAAPTRALPLNSALEEDSPGTASQTTLARSDEREQPANASHDQEELRTPGIVVASRSGHQNVTWVTLEICQF